LGSPELALGGESVVFVCLGLKVKSFVNIKKVEMVCLEKL
jgi:hypothetical protein